MSITLTQTFQDTFQRTNENPLSDSGNWSGKVANWTGGNLQVVSNVCELTTASNTRDSQINVGGTSASNQYASFTFAAAPNFSNDAGATLFVRGSSSSTYELYVAYTQTTARLYSPGALLLTMTGLTINSGDVWVLAVIGTTLYVIQNGTQVGSTTDSTLASGQTALGGTTLGSGAGSDSDIQFSNFASGTAALTTYSISGNAGTIAGATVSWSGTSVGSTTTTSGGAYSITGLSAGSYTVTPSLSSYSFSPTSQPVTISSANVTGINFTATATPSPSGTWSPIDSRVNKPTPQHSERFKVLKSAINR